eukprot:CAMPEP_0115448046 /NCGR_PEP_ID=MMETSP0271-20121206/40285_1 /TAXON_ID=71861 /ORGANISM="Scrippsiella trochoidea, Strain CCMP3099" /LENGTH=446 /DNA_ID=CAMNT_0002874147 /DNA_START=75 /DNA_END=1413 /DNA_ORIENTATION=+
MAAQPPDRAMLASRIQGFGNVNPPPLEEETGATVAKRAVGRLGDMVGEEVMLTVEDFREKGAVGAVKDAVADAGDILIDGVSGLIGWIRGDPPPEEDNEKAEDATKALTNGPAGAAYGISQASPTGGINAVWVMPDEADPTALAQLASQSGGLVAQQNDPRVPKNIQPYQPTPSPHAGFQPPMPAANPMAYQAAQSSHRISQRLLGQPGGCHRSSPAQHLAASPRACRAVASRPGRRAAATAAAPARSSGGPGGYSSGAAGSSAPSGAGASGAKALVERIAKGEVLVGPDVAKRLVSQCQATKTSGKQLGDMVCERTRRLYLGLDGGDPADADASLARLLGLADELQKQGVELAKTAVEDIKKGVNEELLSLRSSAKHKDAAEPMLQRLGLVGKAAAAEVDLLGGAGGRAGGEADLLGGGSAAAAPAKEADLLGGGGGGGVRAAPT